MNRYPLWKNLLLVFLFVIGLIYAAPNLYGEDPAVQVSSTSQETTAADPTAKITEILATNKITAKSITTEAADGSILIRFADTDTQLLARDLIKTALGENYIVALNLAHRTPKWLTAIGANPMKLGLDLQGGVHFLLEININDLLKTRENGDLHTIGDELRDANIRYSGIIPKQPHGFTISFRDQKSQNDAYSEISKRFPDYVLTKIASGADFNINATMSENAVFKVANYAIEQTMTILRKRVNELGVSEAIVQQQGENHISVDLPGIQDTARAKDIIGNAATLKFQMVDVDHDVVSALNGDVPIGSKVYQYEGRPVLLQERVILQGSSITYASASFAQDGRPSVDVRLGGGGESLFNRVTSENIGKPMAVVYIEPKIEEKMVGGKLVKEIKQNERVISIATIQSALGANFQITGLRNVKYAENLALLLRSGELVTPPEIIEELTVGPSMGKANIQKGILSVAVGFVLVVFFMALYYRFFGLLADMALLLNLIFVVAILSVLSATLTLPGIAGMVLTVGMAVDANVLIYERIREELRSGISPQASINSGYARALVTIVDANVTTLIVALVLFALGSGAVKGFAITLTIGLMTSMLTAIVFTRAVVNYIYGRKAVATLSIGLPKRRLG